MNKTLLASLVMNALAFVVGANYRSLMPIIKNTSSCPRGYVCLANAKVIGAENFRTQTKTIGFKKEKVAVPACDLILITSQNERFNIAEDYCESMKSIRCVFGEKVTLMILNDSAISINWKPLSTDYPDMIFMEGGYMRPIQLRAK